VTLKATVTFALTLALCVGAGEFGGRRLPVMRAWFGNVAKPVPDPDKFFLAIIGDPLDHRILFHGFGPSIDYARRADVLLLGDSRVNFGFPDNVLQKVAAESDVHVFNLGFSAGERITFPLDIIRRFDLRPRVVVVNSDRFFFASAGSALAMHMLSHRSLTRDVWQDYKLVVESNIAFDLGLKFHQYVPRFYMAKMSPRLIFFRSHETGSWHWTAAQPITCSVPIAINDLDELLNADERQNAIAFKREMDLRQTTIVLTDVPHNESCSRKLQQLADLLQAPIIIPRVDDLATIDTSHLTSDSATRFSTAFFAEFFGDPQVALALDGIPKMNIAATPYGPRRAGEAPRQPSQRIEFDASAARIPDTLRR
jgi:hypothetical protein